MSSEKLTEVKTCKTPLLQSDSRKRLRVMFVSETFWISIAGIFGALGVIIGAYGEHGLPPDFPAQRKKVFDVANRYQMLHSLALLAVPLAGRPNIVGTLLSVGMIIFCGTCYFHALTGNEHIIRYTPIGGTTLIVGWLSFVL
ncbi:DUF423 domain containing protein-like protein [Dinothrombium tinctorium]|uniref:DUF423 domain containing protein-like protein n=2 Tax=Dinothrombium tinctorium TaxID=1965070 RepID=A0A443QUT6_9ACAR|nr:DUF423 domain containing protein-like protein [Dinothrombium tinctorium]